MPNAGLLPTGAAVTASQRKVLSRRPRRL